jgi:hypothetical protein
MILSGIRRNLAGANRVGWYLFYWNGIKRKTPYLIKDKGLIKKWQRHTLPHVSVVPSALVGLTSLFGMGRGGPHRYSHLKLCSVVLVCCFSIEYLNQGGQIKFDKKKENKSV